MRPLRAGAATGGLNFGHLDLKIDGLLYPLVRSGLTPPDTPGIRSLRRIFPV